MNRWSLYDLDLELQGHEIYIFGHNFSYVCCGNYLYIFNRIEIIRFWTLTSKVKVMKIMSWGIILVMYVVDISDIFHIIGYG